MEKFVQFCIIIAAFAALVAVVLLVLSVMGQKKLFKNIVSNKFTMHDMEEVNIDSGEKTFALIVSNRSMNDAAISAVGIMSGRDYFDFSKRYKEQNSLTEESPIVIQPRMPIKVVFHIPEVMSLVSRSLAGGKFQKIKVYVIDNAGNVFVSKAKNFDTILRKAFATGAVPLENSSVAAEPVDPEN